MSSSFRDLIEGLKGGITSEEAALLRRLAAGVRHGCIVEIGSFQGKSAVALAHGVREAGVQPLTPIYCIDPHRPFVGVYGGVFGPADRGAFYEIMVRTTAFNEVALVNLASDEVASGWKLPVGLLFIDGDHHYRGVKRDFDSWDPHVVTGGLIALDDAMDPAGGPYRLIGEIIQSGCYRQTERIGKIVVLKKAYDHGALVSNRPCQRQRLLVACHDIVLSGGLLRFDRVAAVLRGWGHDLSFVSLAGAPKEMRPTDVPVLTLSQALLEYWDAVMVPGASFPEETIAKFEVFRNDTFGTRVQHILNDQSRRAEFKAVNESFDPHVVIFNNEHWPVGSFTDFKADRFHVLLGAVDSRAFRPMTYRRQPLTNGRWIVGGLATKNPDPLIAALAHMPPGVTLRLFGFDSYDVKTRHEKLIASGNLELTGPLLGDDLVRFYQGVDCIAMTEEMAGWSNLVAEAMASGVPIVCTSHGTKAFSRDEETALVIDATPTALANSLQRLRCDPALCRSLAERGRNTIEKFSWESYSQKLLCLIRHDGRQHYLYAPNVGLYGKWSLEDRLSGLETLLEGARNLSVIDLGAGEGVVAREFLKHDALLVHGFELDPNRVDIANSLCSTWTNVAFRTADLSNWNLFLSANDDLLKDLYDIVLHLGLHQHLPSGMRVMVLKQSIRLVRRYFAFRAPTGVYVSDGVEAVLRAEGLVPMGSETQDSSAEHLGLCRLYKRISAG